jgi:hypothetical protein
MEPSTHQPCPTCGHRDRTRRERLAALTLMVLVPLACVVAAGWQSTSRPGPDTIKARRFEVVDAAGETIAVLGQAEAVVGQAEESKGSCALMLKGQGKRAGRMLLIAHDNGTSQLIMANSDGRPLLAAFTRGGAESRANITFLESSERSGAGIGAGSAGGLELGFRDGGRWAGCEMRTPTGGAPHFTIEDEAGVVHFDSAKK